MCHICLILGSRLNQLLVAILIDKLPLANVLLFTGYPYLILEFAPLLTFDMLESTSRVQARIELANCLNVGEFAIGCRAVSAISTKCAVAERASLVCAIRPEFAILFHLMCNLLSG